MPACGNLEKCGFVLKYKDSKANAVKGFIHLFCEGAMQSQCLRKKYREEHGCPPDDDMMPNGLMISDKP
jgi:hypothetical protein